MAKEIERKFLVIDESYKSRAVKAVAIAQGYLNRDPERTVRVRIYGDKGFITVKTRNTGAVRNEWEYEIPLDDACQMLAVCPEPLEKTRYLVPAANGLCWEVDEFKGRHSGLVMAEIELPAEDTRFEIPSFIGQEVTGDPAYYNSNL